MNDPQISVLIPSYGQTPHLHKVVNSLTKQSIQPLEIIIAHSGDADPSSHLHDPDNGIIVVHSNERWLPGAARNAAASASKGNWLAFIDCDVVAEVGWLEEFVLAAKKHIQPAVFIGSLDHGKSDGYWGRCLWFIESGSVHYYRPEHQMLSAPGANLMISREAFEKAGGFPTSVLIAEDAIFFTKLRELGYQIIFVPGARGSHQYNSNYRHFMTRLFALGKGAARVRASQKLPGSLAVKIPPLALGLWLVRYTQILYRVIQGKGPIIRLASHTPGILLGLASWNLGFLTQSIKNKFDGR